MLAPLFLLWPMSVAITYVVAQNIANGPLRPRAGGQQPASCWSSRVRAEERPRRRCACQRGRARGRCGPTRPRTSITRLAWASRGEYLGGDRDLPLPALRAAASPAGCSCADDARAPATACALAYTWCRPGSCPAPNRRCSSWPRRSRSAPGWPTTSSRASSSRSSWCCRWPCCWCGSA